MKVEEGKRRRDKEREGMKLEGRLEDKRKRIKEWV